MACIFISYSSKSKNLVQSLVQDLEMTGHEIWFDHKLTGGQAWWDQILEQIRQCDVFIFALTPDAMDSYPCKLEYTYAHELGKNVLPVLLADGVSVNLLPAALTTIQFVDYRGEDKQAAFRLVNALNALPAPRPLPDSLPTPPPVPISYIGNLKDQIDAPVTLSFDEQASLVFKIKEHLQERTTGTTQLPCSVSFVDATICMPRSARKLTRCSRMRPLPPNRPARPSRILPRPLRRRLFRSQKQ